MSDMMAAGPLSMENYRNFLLTLVQERTLEGVFDACRVNFDNYPMAACSCVWLWDSEAGLLRLFREMHRTRISPHSWPHPWGFYTETPLEETLIGRVAAERRQASADLDDGWSPPPWVRAENITSYLASPMMNKGELMGVLATFFYPHQHEPRNEGNVLQRMLADYLAAAITNARAFEEIAELKRRIELENIYLREEVKEAYTFGDMVGVSRALFQVIEQVERVAPTNAAVLISGESGVGKELAARAIHRCSPRAAHPMIKVNCASIPKELFESEFFGHMRGSFTGAVKDRVGRFQMADGGVIFLDEVGEIPIELQSKLLRVLQEGAFEPVGENRTRTVDVRVIAATNRDLISEIRAGRFRNDLYYRLCVFPITMPSLRERPEDIHHLTDYFMTETARRMGRPKPSLKKRHVKQLTAYTWPGNVRELKNAVERALIISSGSDLDFGFLPSDTTSGRPADSATTHPGALKQILTESDMIALQKQNITRALELAGGRVEGHESAAELLNLKPSTLRSRMKSLGIDRKPFSR